MTTISEIFRTFGPEYLDQFSATMPGEQRKAMQAIIECRTEAAGIALYECQQCGQPHVRLHVLRQPALSNLSAP